MTLIPLPRDGWTEALGRRIVTDRAAQPSGIPSCEACGETTGLHWSHRIARSRGGSWAPSNGVLLCLVAHGWAHTFPKLARSLGWHLNTHDAPAEAPVWLARPYPGWWLLDDGGLLTPVHAEDHPDLPTTQELWRYLPPAARGALT